MQGRRLSMTQNINTTIKYEKTERSITFTELMENYTSRAEIEISINNYLENFRKIELKIDDTKLILLYLRQEKRVNKNILIKLYEFKKVIANFNLFLEKLKIFYKEIKSLLKHTEKIHTILKEKIKAINNSII